MKQIKKANISSYWSVLMELNKNYINVIILMWRANLWRASLCNINHVTSYDLFDIHMYGSCYDHVNEYTIIHFSVLNFVNKLATIIFYFLTF